MCFSAEPSAAAGRTGTLAFDGGLNALWIINPEWHSLECSPAVSFDGQRVGGGGNDARSSYFQCFSSTFPRRRWGLGAARFLFFLFSPASLFPYLSNVGKSLGTNIPLPLAGSMGSAKSCRSQNSLITAAIKSERRHYY